MLNHQAAVHDDRQPSGSGPRRRPLVNYTELQPDGAHALGDGVLDDPLNIFRAAEHIYQFDRPGDVAKGRICLFAQHLRLIGIDGDDAVTGALQVFRDAVTRL